MKNVVSVQELRDHFQKYGDITDVWLSDLHYGFINIVLSDHSAEEAVKAFSVQSCEAENGWEPPRTVQKSSDADDDMEHFFTQLTPAKFNSDKFIRNPAVWKKLQEQPRADRSDREEPGAARSSQEQPGGARSSQEQPGSPK